jgi:acyl phosphate:glycerol-3-phosphate acyltransferase
MKLIVAMVLSYLIGSIPWGLWLGRVFKDLDIREYGSRNIGATNAWRVLGPKLGVTVLVLDVLKGAIPVVVLPALLGIRAPSSAVELLIGAAAILGHVFPAFLQFRGGKGVATALGVFLAIAPAPMIVTLLVGVIIIARWGYVSAASVSGAVLFPLLLWVFGEGPLVLLVSAVFALVIIVRHRANIHRIAEGAESRIWNCRFSAGDDEPIPHSGSEPGPPRP